MKDLQTWSDLNRGVKKKAEEPKKNHWYEMYELECLKTKQLQEENLKLEAKVRTLEIEQNYCLPNCSKIANLEAQIKQLVFLHNEDVNTIKLLNKQIKEIKEK